MDSNKASKTLMIKCHTSPYLIQCRCKRGLKGPMFGWSHDLGVRVSGNAAGFDGNDGHSRSISTFG